MTSDRSEASLERLSMFMSRRLGLHFPPDRWSDLRDGIAAAAAELRFADADSCIRWLLSSSPSKEQLETLAGFFTVGETYFFRQPRQFEVLAGEILPELIRTRASERRLRLWSAGCCTGEEAYSLAILLDRFSAELAGWNVSILATDVNPKFLRKAESGVYGDWSFRDVPNWIRDAYFRKLPGGRLEIVPRMKDAVTFSLLNLADDAYPSLVNGTNAMDVILCRNVLMYFHPDRADDVAARLKLCLAERGCLFVSPSEASASVSSRFETVRYADCIAYRQSGALGGEAPPNPPAQGSDAPPPLPRAAALPPPERTEDVPAPEPGRGLQDLVLRARSLANQARLSEALECCDAAIGRDKLDASVHYLKGAILQEQGRLEEAAASLRRTLYLDSNFVLARFSLGNIARRGRRPEEARRHFKAALAALETLDAQEMLPESDGLSAGRMKEIVASALERLGERS